MSVANVYRPRRKRIWYVFPTTLAPLLVVLGIIYILPNIRIPQVPLSAPIPSTWKIVCYPRSEFTTKKLRTQLQLPSSAKNIDHFEYMGVDRFGCGANMSAVIINTDTH